MITDRSPSSSSSAATRSGGGDIGGGNRILNIVSSEPFLDKYRTDQLSDHRTLTDLHLACDDGHVPVHRYLMMGVSPLLKSILLDQVRIDYYETCI